jgi:regulatory protein
LKGRNTDKPEPGDGSSSPSGEHAAVKVVSLELGGAGGERVKVHLSNGSFFVLHAEIAAREGIRADRELQEDEIPPLISASEIVFARGAALGYLSRAPQTRRGLSLKLRKKGFSAASIRLALDRMSELGYLDDGSFARNWVRNRMETRREGWMALLKGLVQRGVPRAQAEEAVAGACTDEAELEAARSLVRGLPPRKAAARLTAKGFRSRTIGRVLREGGAPESEGPEE